MHSFYERKHVKMKTVWVIQHKSKQVKKEKSCGLITFHYAMSGWKTYLFHFKS